MAVGDQAAPAVLSYVAVGKEGTFATYASATTAIEAISCSFKVDVKSQKLDTLFGNRGFAKRVPLEKSVSGTLEQYLHPQESVLLIANALAGQISSTAQTNSTLHSISAGNFANSIASLSFNVRKGGASGPGPFTWRYVGGRCNSLKISAEAGGVVKCSYDMVFVDASLGTDDISGILSISSVQPFTFVGGSFVYAASEGAITTTLAEPVTQFELTVNNGIKSDKDVRSLGTNTVMRLPGTRREVTLKVNQRFDTTTVYNRFLQATEGSVELNFSGAAIVANTTASEYFMRMQIRLPRVVQATGDPELKSSGDILNAELTYDVLIDNPSTSTGREIGVTVTNSTASY